MMKSFFLGLSAFLVLFVVSPVAAEIVEDGDLNIINDPGNPSNGLRFLDLSYGYDKTKDDALISAQSAYANARLATASEMNDLVAASDIVLNDPLFLPESGFEAGAPFFLSSGGNYDDSLRSILGEGSTSFLAAFWTDPDGDLSNTSTRDFLRLDSNSLDAVQSSITPSNPQVSWLMVSPAVPEPNSLALVVLASLGFTVRRHKKLR